jgi:hypothetical protein
MKPKVMEDILKMFDNVAPKEPRKPREGASIQELIENMKHNAEVKK